MNFKYIALLFVSFVCLLASCDNDTENVVSSPSKDAQIASFSITAIHNKELKDSLERATDSLRFVVLGKTKFAIDQVGSLIYNPDSLPYGTILDKVALKLTYKGSPNSLEIELKDSTYNWNSSDSIDFSKRPIKFNVNASGVVKRYTIDIRIHKIDPDVLVWSYRGVLSKNSERKTVLFGNNFYSFIKNALGVPAVDIIDKNFNTEEKLVSGLPVDTRIGSVTVLNDAFYAVSNSGKSYTSTDGTTWSEQTNGKIIANVLGVIPGAKASDDKLAVLVNEGGLLYFGLSKDLSSVNQLSQMPSNFPVRGFASATNFSRDKKNNMLLVSAGLDGIDNLLSSTWWLKLGVDGDFQFAESRSTTLFKGGGLSSFFYDNQLYLFAKKEFYVSSDWGGHWAKAPAKQALSTQFGSRFSQSVIVQNNNIWIFGGVSESGTYFSDVWSGILNRLK